MGGPPGHHPHHPHHLLDHLAPPLAPLPPRGDARRGVRRRQGAQRRVDRGPGHPRRRHGRRPRHQLQRLEQGEAVQVLIYELRDEDVTFL